MEDCPVAQSILTRRPGDGAIRNTNALCRSRTARSLRARWGEDARILPPAGRPPAGRCSGQHSGPSFSRRRPSGSPVANAGRFPRGHTFAGGSKPVTASGKNTSCTRHVATRETHVHTDGSGFSWKWPECVKTLTDDESHTKRDPSS